MGMKSTICSLWFHCCLFLFAAGLLCIRFSYWIRLFISWGRYTSIAHHSAKQKLLNNGLLAVFFFVSGLLYEMSTLTIFHAYKMAVFEILNPFSWWRVSYTHYFLFCNKLETSLWLKSYSYLGNDNWDVKLFIIFLLEIFHLEESSLCCYVIQ